MKKSLLTLAVLGAFAGAASAQSSVTIYGVVDAGIGSNDIGTAGRSTGLISGGQSPSRIGFKGTEDLGGGLAATFQLEGGINVDEGTTGSGNQLFNRTSTIGLQGGFGAVNLGRQTTVLKDAHDQVDPFGGAGIFGNVERVFYNGGLNSRVSNTIKYSSNSYSGFKGQASYTFGEARGNNDTDSGYGLGLGYANGPLNVQFAYNNQNDIDPGTYNKQKIAFLGATYNFGGFKLHGAYSETKLDLVAGLGGGSDKYRNGLVGVSVPVGAVGNILASYAINDNRNAGNADSQQAAIAYTHDLSKRTNLYAGYAHTSNDGGAALGGSNTGFSNSVVPAGENVSTVAVGIRHKF